MLIRSIPDLQVFIEEFCKIAEEKFGLSQGAIQIKFNEGNNIVAVEIDNHCNNKLLIRMFKEQFSIYKNANFCVYFDDIATTFSFWRGHSLRICADIYTLIHQYIAVRTNSQIAPILSQINKEGQVYNDSNGVQVINSTIQSPSNHQEVIMYTIGLLIPLLNRTSDWYTALKSSMAFYTSNAPTASRIKLELEKFLKSPAPFSSIGFQTFICILQQRRKHIDTLAGYHDEKGYIDTILNSAQILTENEKQLVQKPEQMEDFVILGHSKK